MALINKVDGSYIRILSTNGEYEIYPSRGDRDGLKATLDFETVLSYYDKMHDYLYNLLLNKICELDYNIKKLTDLGVKTLTKICKNYPDIKSMYELVLAFEEERQNYINDYKAEKGAQHHYAIMMKNYPPVHDTIPNIVERHQSSMIKADTLTECYEKAKKFNIFGSDVEDC